MKEINNAEKLNTKLELRGREINQIIADDMASMPYPPRLDFSGARCWVNVKGIWNSDKWPEAYEYISPQEHDAIMGGMEEHLKTIFSAADEFEERTNAKIKILRDSLLKISKLDLVRCEEAMVWTHQKIALDVLDETK